MPRRLLRVLRLEGFMGGFLGFFAVFLGVVIVLRRAVGGLQEGS